MDSTQLERTALETKDRDELTTIATALGGKPGSRSRKAEIVDLILDLAGVEGTTSAGSTNGVAPVTEALTEEPPAAWEVEAEAVDKAAEKAEATESKEGSGDSSDRDGRSQQKPKQESQNRDGDLKGGNQGRNRQPDQAGPGNRRRRRSGGGRGRDRDNTPEEPWDGEPVAIDGYIDLRDEGYGFLGSKRNR